MATPLDPHDLVTRNPHTPDHWLLALSLWVAFQLQPAQLKVEHEAWLQAWEAEDAARQRNAIRERST